MAADQDKNWFTDEEEQATEVVAEETSEAVDDIIEASDVEIGVVATEETTEEAVEETTEEAVEESAEEIAGEAVEAAVDEVVETAEESGAMSIAEEIQVDMDEGEMAFEESSPLAQYEGMPSDMPANWKGSDTPPATLFRLDDGHWTPYTLPLIPEGAEVFAIESGDTLWDLGTEHLGDPYLWPSIWEYNQYIKDPHWIYPGDPLSITATTVLDNQTIADAEAVARALDIGEGGDEDEGFVTTRKEEAVPRIIFEDTGEGPYPAATFDEMYCSYYVLSKERKLPDLHISAIEKVEFVEAVKNDIVYISQGSNDGIEPGMEFSVVHKGEKVTQPNSFRRIGHAVYQTGRIRVVAVQAGTATAKVVYSCREMAIGDHLFPWREIPTPLTADRVFEPTAYASSGKLEAKIVYTKEYIQAVSTNYVVTVDAGTQDGLVPGDYFSIYMDNPSGDEYQRLLLGELIVLFSEPETSTCKIMTAYRDIKIGEKVELQ